VISSCVQLNFYNVSFSPLFYSVFEIKLNPYLVLASQLIFTFICNVSVHCTQGILGFDLRFNSLLSKFRSLTLTSVANLPPVSTAPTGGTAGVFDTGGKFAVDTGGKFLPPIPLMLLILMANFPPVSLTPVANCQQYQRHWPSVSTTLVANNVNIIRLPTPYSELAGKNLSSC
jgi:hypothetical protein